MAPPAANSDIALSAPTAHPLPESKDPLPTSTSLPSLFELRNKTIAVTGGGRGLGITFALAVIEAGGNAACIDILPQPAQVEWAHLSKLASARGQSVSYHRCDVTDEEAMRQVFDEIDTDATVRGFPLTGSIVCAGIQQQIPALEYPAADFERIQKVNVVGAFVTAKTTANVLVKNKTGGSIVLIASMSGQIANRGLSCSAYNSSKAAVQQMCRSLSQEWGQYGIRINTLSPGYIRTAMTDQLLTAEPEVEKTWMRGALLGRLGVPEDFKAPVIFLLSEGSRFMTGADLRVDGGHCASA